MTTIDKIRAEIDKRYAEYRAKMKTDDFTYYEGMADALDLFEQFLDTLEEPVSDCHDLNEAAEEYIKKGRYLPEAFFVRPAFKAGAEWQARQLLKSSPLPEDTVIFQKGVEEGRRLEREDALSIADIEKLHTFLYAVKNNKHGAFTFTRLSDEQYEEVLRRFNKTREQ